MKMETDRPIFTLNMYDGKCKVDVHILFLVLTDMENERRNGCPYMHLVFHCFYFSGNEINSMSYT